MKKLSLILALGILGLTHTAGDATAGGRITINEYSRCGTVTYRQPKYRVVIQQRDGWRGWTTIYNEIVVTGEARSLQRTFSGSSYYRVSLYTVYGLAY